MYLTNYWVEYLNAEITGLKPGQIKLKVHRPSVQVRLERKQSDMFDTKRSAEEFDSTFNCSYS